MGFRRIFLSIVSIFTVTCSFAAINAQHSFENGIPSFVKVNGNGSVNPSTEKFKDGKTSMRFDWNGQAELLFTNYADLEKSMQTWHGGVIFWIYNPSPIQAPLTFTFLDWNGNEICHFDFNLDYSGWRTAWVKYDDMKMPGGGYRYQIPTKDRPTNVAKLSVRPSASVPRGTIYIDRVSFPATRLHDQITPDKQIPDNNCSLQRNMWHWCRLWEWEQYPMYEINPVTAEQEAMLARVEERMDVWADSGNPGPEYTQSTLLKRADDAFAKYGLKRLPDGSVTGAPLMSDDEFNNSKGEMRIRFIQEICYWYALDYLYTGNKANLDKVWITLDHALDQGFAFGSGWGTNHHYGYQVRDLYKALWILRKEAAKTPNYREYVKTLAYWSGIAETRLPFQEFRDEMLDSWNTLLGCKVISAMLAETPADRYAAMKALGTWVSGSMLYSQGTIGGIKPDGTTFHHGGLYPAYSVGAFAALGNWCDFTSGTDFVPDEPARRCFKHALLTMRNYCNLTDWGVGICGRHPFNGFIPKADIEAYGRLAVLGDLTGSGLEVDPELGGAYLTLGGADKKIIATIRKAGISACPAPEGFFVYNYGAIGIHRRDNWMISLKAFNSDVWSSEIYTNDNRFGRYQSYGTAQYIGGGNPVSAKASGYSQEGWDWNRMPGATTVHLPFELLESPQRNTLMERNDSRFPGVSSLEGRNGVLAFTYKERKRKNFCEGAMATKSVFCFDNRIIYIGTGISNSGRLCECDGTIYPTETTLYQYAIEDKAAQVDINSEYFDAFPFSWYQSEHEKTVITDPQGNFYILPDGYGLTVLKKHQSSPSDTKKKTGEGDFMTALINHGTAPQDASYEYMMLVRPSNKEVSKFSKSLPYTVIKADNDAHVVNDHLSGTTAYVCYGQFRGASCREAFSRLPKGKEAKPYLPVSYIDRETIVMERSLDGITTVMSVCTPDLGITEKGYTTIQASQPIVKKVVLAGKYALAADNSQVEVTSEGEDTALTVTCLHGQPVEFNLIKK